jgi:hypothetical protein
MRPTILLALLAAFTLSAMGQQKVVKNNREEFLKRVYFNTNDVYKTEGSAIITLKDMVENDLSTKILERSKHKRLKSAQTTISVVDSVYTYNWIADIQDWDTIPMIKGYFTYNHAGQETSYTELSFDGEFWVNSNRSLTEYDVNGNLINFVEQYASITDSGDVWINIDQYIYKYNNQHQDTAIIFDTWDESNNIWLASWKNIIEYSSLGEITKYIRQDWDINNDEWVNSWQYLNEFNTQNNLEKYTEKLWSSDNQDWIDHFKIEYSYNSLNLNNLKLTFLFNTATLNWDTVNRISIYYTTQQLQQIILTEKWNAINTAWIKSDSVINEYSEKLLNNNTRFKWDSNETTWINNYQINYQYNSNDLVNLILNRYWNKASSLWQNESQFNYNYDLSGNVIELRNLSWDNALNNWGSGNRTIYSRSNIIVDEIIYSHFLENSLYPNPSSNFLKVNAPNELKNYSIYNISGQIVLKGAVYHSREIKLDISNLNNGLYIIETVDVNSYVKLNKFIKK